MYLLVLNNILFIIHSEEHIETCRVVLMKGYLSLSDGADKKKVAPLTKYMGCPLEHVSFFPHFLFPVGFLLLGELVEKC